MTNPRKQEVADGAGVNVAAIIDYDLQTWDEIKDWDKEQLVREVLQMRREWYQAADYAELLHGLLSNPSIEAGSLRSKASACVEG